jgi:hypothetical protein
MDNLYCGRIRTGPCKYIGRAARSVRSLNSRLKEIGAVELPELHIVVKDLGALEGLAEAG